MSSYHIPVLLEESVSALIGDTGGIYADATYGGGGHTSEILSRLTGNGRVIAFDRDSDAIANASSDSRLTLIQSNFRFIHNYIMLLGRGSGINTDNIHGCTDPLPSEGIDGILADLGVSSHQFDTPERGFSFRYDSPLDMRMEGPRKDSPSVRGGGQQPQDSIPHLQIKADRENLHHGRALRSHPACPARTCRTQGPCKNIPGSENRGEPGDEVA